MKRMINRNEFNLSHKVMQTARFGQLLPFLVQEVLPGDTMKFDTNCLVRLQPMLAPQMSDIYGKMELFFVPNRLIWSEWANFITGGERGNLDIETPKIDFGDEETFPNGCPEKSLFDYLGICTGYKGQISSFPIRAINLIWNEWYRDEIIQGKRNFTFLTYQDDQRRLDWSIPFRNFEKDYFTCAFPYAQKGDPVMLPLADMIPVVTTSGEHTTSGMQTPLKLRNTRDNSEIGQQPAGAYQFPMDVTMLGGVDGELTSPDRQRTYASGGYMPIENQVTSLENFRNRQYYPSNLWADTSQAVMTSIDDIRKAFQIQRFQVMNLKGGSRYVEYIYNYYGVRSADARVQRPELLASNTFNVVVSEVVQTSQSQSEQTPTATLYGKGITAGSTGVIEKSFDEHGLVIGLYSIQPKTMYSQMVERQHTRFSKYDYYNPCFAFLGYQAILNRELVGTHDNPDEIFGFQGRYDEYRHRESYCCGDFRTSLKYWHLARELPNNQTLNTSFLNATNASDRIFSYTGDDYLLCEFYNDILALRPLPKDSDPGLIDHVYY